MEDNTWIPEKCGKGLSILHPGGRVARERTRRLVAPGRSEARVNGRAHSDELPVNVVRMDKSKRSMPGILGPVNLLC